MEPTPNWLFSSKPHHWGHANPYLFIAEVKISWNCNERHISHNNFTRFCFQFIFCRNGSGREYEPISINQNCFMQLPEYGPLARLNKLSNWLLCHSFIFTLIILQHAGFIHTDFVINWYWFWFLWIRYWKKSFLVMLHLRICLIWFC